MKFERTPAFDADFRRLKREHQRTFRRVVVESFAPACDAYVAALPASFRWPSGLRVSAIKGSASIMEMTWSFASPDGRATFEFVTVDGEIRCRWRRVGDHDVFDRP